MEHVGTTAATKSIVPRELIEAFTLNSNATNAISLTIGDSTKNITAATLKESLGVSVLDYISHEAQYQNNNIDAVAVSTNLRLAIGKSLYLTGSSGIYSQVAVAMDSSTGALSFGNTSYDTILQGGNGTQNATITLTGKATQIDNNAHGVVSISGNVGIGIADPTYNYKLYVNGASYLAGNTSIVGGVLNITGVTGYAQGIRIHHASGYSSIYFGATNDTGLDAGMWGLTLDSNGFRVRGMASTSATSLLDYVNIAYGGAVTLNGATTINESSSSTTGQIVLTAGSSPSITVGGKTLFATSGSGTTLTGNLGDTTIPSVIRGSSVTVSTNMSVTGNIEPTTNATYNLGSSSKRFERAYIRYIDTPSNVLLRFCTAGTEAMNISTSGNVNIGSTSSASYKLQVNGTFYASGAVTLGSSLSTSGDISTSGDVVITKTANNPAVTFKGEYDNNLGANITLGSITGNKETISSTVYTGVKVSSDFFIPNGKHLYTYNYSGAPRSIAYYATANYDYLQLGDSAGVTNIKGSTVYINDSALGNAAFKGVATSISSSSTDANLATAKAVYDYVSTNCVTSSVLEDYVLSSSLGAAATKGVVTSLSSTSTNLITSKAVYDGCKHRFFKEYASTDFDNGSTTVDTWWRVGSIGTPYSSLDFVFTNNYNSDECASVYFNISQGYMVNGAKIGQPNYVITQTGGYNKFIKAIRIVYYNANRGSSYPTAYIELLLSAGSTNKLWCECSTTHQTFTWRDTPILGFIGGSSAASTYRATTLYTSRGPTTSGGYDCGWLFDLAANASIGQTSASQFLIPQFLNAISTGTPVLWRTESVTINSVTYTTRFDVHVARRGSAAIMLYYFNSPNSQTVEMNCIEIGYSSGWKVTAKYTKTLS